MNIDDSVDYKVNNFAPDMDVIQMEFGKHIDSCITVTVDRDENGQVNVLVVDNFDGSEHRMILGQPGLGYNI
jgi:hypothetical protein